MKRRTVLGGRARRGRRTFDAGLSEGAIEQEDVDPDLEHRRPGGAVQGGVRRLPEGQSRRRDRVARQEGPGAAGLLPDPARRRHAARRHQHRKGALWVEYAANGALLDLTPYFAEGAGGRKLLQRRTTSANWVYEGKNYMVPFYVTKTLLFYNKTMFKEAGPRRAADRASTRS